MARWISTVLAAGQTVTSVTCQPCSAKETGASFAPWDSASGLALQEADRLDRDNSQCSPSDKLDALRCWQGSGHDMDAMFCCLGVRADAPMCFGLVKTAHRCCKCLCNLLQLWASFYSTATLWKFSAVLRPTRSSLASQFYRLKAVLDDFCKVYFPEGGFNHVLSKTLCDEFFQRFGPQATAFYTHAESALHLHRWELALVKHQRERLFRVIQNPTLQMYCLQTLQALAGPLLQELGPNPPCVVNLLTGRCVARHASVFMQFPPVHGPPLQGHILDFLGVSTSDCFQCACNKALPDYGQAPNRVLECVSHAAGEGWRSWPVLDEEYFEWMDVLGAAWTAARHGHGFAVAEVGAGSFMLWAVRAAKAFLRLAAPGSRCQMLGIEPQVMNQSRLQQHLAANLDSQGCNISVLQDPIEGAEDLIRALGGPGACDHPWDLVDIDAEGAEVAVFSENISWLAQCVRRLHVSTHGNHSDNLVFNRLKQSDWIVTLHLPTHGVSLVHGLGPVSTMDGHITAFPPQTSQASTVWW